MITSDSASSSCSHDDRGLSSSFAKQPGVFCAFVFLYRGNVPCMDWFSGLASVPDGLFLGSERELLSLMRALNSVKEGSTGMDQAQQTAVVCVSRELPG